MKTINLLTKFVNQRPNLEFANYGDVKAYNQESREITKDRSDYFELYELAYARLGDTFEDKLKFNLEKSNGRLTLVESKGEYALQYITGQYFPTEYRHAANRILAQLIWNDYSNEQHDTKTNGFEPTYKTGNEIRKAIKRRGVSRRVMKYYFN